MLADGGFPLGSQTVLLRGVNDRAEIIKKLAHELLKIRVRPYYLYQCDPVQGTAHFRTPVSKGLEIMESLRGHTTGYAVPPSSSTPPAAAARSADAQLRRQQGREPGDDQELRRDPLPVPRERRVRVGLAFDHKDAFVRRPEILRTPTRSGTPRRRSPSSRRGSGPSATRSSGSEGGATSSALGARPLGVDLVFNICEGRDGRSREPRSRRSSSSSRSPTRIRSADDGGEPRQGIAKRLLRDRGVATPDFAVVTDPSQADSIRIPFPLFVSRSTRGPGRGSTPTPSSGRRRPSTISSPGRSAATTSPRSSRSTSPAASSASASSATSGRGDRHDGGPRRRSVRIGDLLVVVEGRMGEEGPLPLQRGHRALPARPSGGDGGRRLPGAPVPRLRPRRSPLRRVGGPERPRGQPLAGLSPSTPISASSRASRGSPSAT